MSGFIIGTIIKKIIATTISIVITISTFLTGNYGEYQKLAIKPLSFKDNLLTEISMKLTLSPEVVFLLSDTVSDEEIVYDINFSLLTDKEQLKLTLLDSNGQHLLILDQNGLAVSSEFVTAALSIVGKDYLSAYNKYFYNKTFYSDFNELISYDSLSYEELDAIKALQESTDMLDLILKLLESEESISYFAKLCSYEAEMLNKYYTQCEIEGVTGYSVKMNITDSFKFMKDYLSYSASEEYIETTASLIEYLVWEISKVYPEFAPEAGTDIKEVIKETFSSFENDEDLHAILDAVISEDTQVLGELAVLLPFIRNSFAENVIYEKDSVISERTRAVISDGKTEYVTFEATMNSMNSDEEIPSSEEFATFENRVTFEQIDCPRALDKAQNEKVSDIDISWISTMSQNDSDPIISDASFSVYYYTRDIDDEEVTAYLLDGSIYLPLRKIMEYAGYDVSWDSKNRKAYVIVDANPVDMTGVLIDGKTYVKIRDFEKIGADVSYYENFLYNNAYNDFQKECSTIIVFGE